MWGSHRPHPLASPCAGRKLLVLFLFLEREVQYPFPPLTRGHCCQIAENSAKKLKYGGRKKLFTERNWNGILAEIADK
jgi:hypothetical protein